MKFLPKIPTSSGLAPTLQRPPKGKFFLADRTFDRTEWWETARLRKLYFFCYVLVLAGVANGFDGSMMNGLQALSYWQKYFNQPHGSILGLYNSAMSLGSIIGLPLVPPLVDRFGRKAGIVVSSLIIFLGVGIQTGARNFGMFLAARFLLGFGLIFAASAAPLLIAELSHPQDRSVMVTFMGCSYGIGSFIGSWVTFGTLKIESDWAWRLPSLLQCSCTVVVMIFIWWIPESPRFYIERDQSEKALQILAYYHANGNEDDELVRLEYTEIRTALILEKQEDKKSRYIDFLKTPGNRKRIFLVACLNLFGQWSGNGIVSYYLHIVMDMIGIKDDQDQLGINSGLASLSLTVTLCVAFFVDRLGRRSILLTSTIGMLFSFVIWTIFSARYAQHPNDGMGRGVVVMIFIYNFFYNYRSGVMTNYMIEILPYRLRAKGLTLGASVTLSAVFFNQYINSIALDNLHWRYYIFYDCFLLVELIVIYFFIVETRYVPLEEIAKYFDGDQADVATMTNAQVEKDIMEKGGATEIETSGQMHTSSNLTKEAL